MKRTALKTLAVIGMALFAAPLSQAENPQPEWIQRTPVFTPGDFNSKFYRIPGIVTAPDGTLVAVADKRIESNADLPGKIDVVVRRSEDDGKTWSDYIVVAANDEGGGYGDPAIVVDEKSGDILVISTHGNGLWQKTPGHIMVSRSKDYGKTWEKPVDISSQILTTDPNGPQPIKCQSAFASSGRALQLRDGRIIFAIIVREENVKNFKCYSVFSDDGGHTWNVSWNPADDNADEAKVVELPDGKLIMSTRNRFKGPRHFSYSTDRGRSWSAPVLKGDLIDPACNGDIIWYNYGGRDLLLQSLPGSPTERKDVTIYASEDGGKTWPYKRVLTEAGSAYSSMTILPDGSIGVLTEEDFPKTDPKVWPYQIWFTSVPLDFILQGR